MPPEVQGPPDDAYRILFEANPLPTWVFDPGTLDILAVNRACAACLGYSRDELLSMKLSELKLPEDVPRLLGGLSRGSPGYVWSGVVRQRCKDGRVVHLEVTAHRIRLGGRDAQLAIGRDVSEAGRVEAQLAHAQKMEALGRLAGGVAHDFNNMLAAILLNASLARRALAPDAAALVDLGEIQKAAQRSTRIVKRLLAFSRQQPSQARPLDLNDVILDLVSMLRRLLGEDIALKVEGALDPSPVLIDPGQIEQVIVNLAVNARDAMPRGGRVKIRTDKARLGCAAAAAAGVSPGEYVVLSVQDTGVGMDAATRAHLFEPFFTTKEIGKGTGLGLATAYGFVKQAHGAIAVESEAGRGTCFRIYLPRYVAAEDARSGVIHAVGSDPAVRAPPRAILLVEDDELVRASIGAVLQREGFHVIEARDGEQAFRRAAAPRTHVDLLLTDVVMPGMKGPDLARSLGSRFPGLKVLFMSGHLPDLPGGTLPEGARLLEKPFDAQSLVRAVQEAIAEGE